MVSKKSIRKSNRAEAVARESFRRFSNASWALDLARGDELDAPRPDGEQEQIRAEFWRQAEAVTQSTLRVNLRNISARFTLGRIQKEQIPAACEAVRQSERNR